MSDSSIPTKTCSKCQRAYPATLEYFHRNKRYSHGLNNWCKNCNRLWRSENRQALLQKKHDDYHAQKNDAEFRIRKAASSIRYRAENVEKNAEYSHLYRLSHKQQRREYDKKFREQNPDYYTEYQRDWRNEKPEKVTEYNHRRRTLRLGDGTLANDFTDQDWKCALQYFDYRCAICGREADEDCTIAADHWILLNRSECLGTTATNMIPLCHGKGGCNNAKRDYMPERWVIRKYGESKGLKIIDRIDAYFDWVRGLENAK